MTELFLISITILTVFIRGEEKAPALVYCLVAHALNYCAIWLNNDAQIFISGALLDLLVIILLVCLNGCLRSKITFFLIPISIFSIFLHFYGWSIYQSGMSISKSNFNSFVIFYYCLIWALLISQIGRNGDTRRHNRFLRRDNNSHSPMGALPK